jgi:hypothetical protein
MAPSASSFKPALNLQKGGPNLIISGDSQEFSFSLTNFVFSSEQFDERQKDRDS